MTGLSSGLLVGHNSDEMKPGVS